MIITISREFGSGGRELGKRLAEALGYDYYDKEILAALADQKELNETYMQNALNQHMWRSIPLTFRHSFYGVYYFSMPDPNLIAKERCLLESIAKSGKNCVIVGCNADILLREYRPFKIFVCADMDAKVRRCTERAEESEKLSRKELEQNITRIDKNRRHTRELLTDQKWGTGSAYHLTVNTTNWIIKELVLLVAEFVKSWGDRSAQD